MTGPGARPLEAPRAAILFGLLSGFVALVNLVRLVRPSLLTDPDPGWAAPRLLLGLAVAGASGIAAVVGAGLLWGWVGSRFCADAPAALALRGAPLALVAAIAILAGSAARFAALDRIPESLFLDDVSLIEPALALSGSWSDFADAIRPVPFGVPKLFGTVGVAYLEAFRVTLRTFGTTVFGLRFLSAAAGVVSLLTAALLGRALLPRGGGALAALVLAGLRWHLILSRWGWNMIVLAPLVDVATLLLVASRRRRGARAALAAISAGAVAGLCAHVYLSAWIAAAALGGFALWSCASDDRLAARLRRAALFGAGFALVAAPLFLLREGRVLPYFARTGDHNALREVRYQRSLAPIFSNAADSLVAPWLTADPTSRQDLPERSRLGWILGVPALAVFVRSLVRPREELSGLLLLHAAAALAATLVAGEAGTPNGARFGYLTTVTAVAVAAGVQLLLAAGAAAQRRPSALAALGLIAVAGTLGARDALVIWPQRSATFDGFHGADTLLGRAAARWEEFGRVEIAPELGQSPVTINGVRRYRLDPDPPLRPARGIARAFRIVSSVADVAQSARVVERVRDAWGRAYAVVVRSPL